MGRDKATLPFGPDLMLQRVVRLLSTVVDVNDIVVVSAADQTLPELPSQVSLACDHRESRGPLEGLSAGFAALPRHVDAAYATSCDVPLLIPALVTRMFELLGEFEIVVPRENEQFHPLAAVYRPSVVPVIQQLLAADQLRLRFLFDKSNTRYVDVDELRDVDPDLRTLMNLNQPEDYQLALKTAGLLP